MDDENFFKNLEETNLDELIHKYLEVFLIIKSNILSLSENENLNYTNFYVWFNMIKMITKRFKMDDLIYYDYKDNKTSDDVYDLISKFIKFIIFETSDENLGALLFELNSINSIILRLTDLFVKNQIFPILPPIGFRFGLPSFNKNELCQMISNFIKGYKLFKKTEQFLEKEKLKEKKDSEDLFFIIDYEFKFFDISVYRYFKKYHNYLFEKKPQQSEHSELNLKEKFYFDNDSKCSNDQLIKEEQSIPELQTSTAKVLTTEEIFRNYLIKENQSKNHFHFNPEFKQSTSNEQTNSQIKNLNTSQFDSQIQINTQNQSTNSIQEFFPSPQLIQHNPHLVQQNIQQLHHLVQKCNHSLMQNRAPQFHLNQTPFSNYIPFFHQSQILNHPFTVNNPMIPFYIPPPILHQQAFNEQFNQHQLNQNRNQSPIQQYNINKQMSSRSERQSKYRFNQQIPKYHKEEKMDQKQNLQSTSETSEDTTTRKCLTYADALTSETKKRNPKK